MSDTPDREEAVEILLCIADLYGDGAPFAMVEDLTSTNSLAREAWLEIAFDYTTNAEDMLEAASLVRDGWNPGDSVEGVPR
jgi:hypothetical protein